MSHGCWCFTLALAVCPWAFGTRRVCGSRGAAETKPKLRRACCAALPSTIHIPPPQQAAARKPPAAQCLARTHDRDAHARTVAAFRAFESLAADGQPPGPCRLQTPAIPARHQSARYVWRHCPRCCHGRHVASSQQLADTPQSPSRAHTQTPPSYLSQALSDALESPHDVYNLAATLTTTTRHAADTAAAQHDDAAHFDSQLRSLRANLDEHTQALSQIGVHLGQHDASLDRHQARLERSRDRLRSLVERDRTELEHRDRTDRLRRVMNRLGRLGAGNVVSLSAAPGDAGASAYGDRVPSRNSLYDWSPATDEADDEAELEGILAELRREQPCVTPPLLCPLSCPLSRPGPGTTMAEHEMNWLTVYQQHPP